MTLDRSLLVRYLRQREELGEREIFLDTLTAEAALALLRGRPGRRVAGGEAVVGAAAPPRPPVSPEAPASEGLAALAAEAAGCTRCRLCDTRQTVVFGEGNPAAAVMVVGEAPGQEEDRTGRPFVGPAGRLLDLLLMTAGFPREEVYICNVLKCRPPGNRNPLPDEIAQCAPYLRRQVELISPRVLVAAGKFAAQTLLETEASIGALRGQVHRYHGVPLVATYHPAFLLRDPKWIRAAWEDFQLVRRVLEG